MKKVALVALLGVASLASAEGFYLRGNLGASLASSDLEYGKKDVDINSGLLAGFALGYQISPSLAVEGDLRARRFTVDENFGNVALDADINMLSFMFNGVYEFDFDMLRPYVKAGVGIANVDTDGKARIRQGNISNTYHFDNSSDTNIAWAVGTGMNLQLNKDWLLNFDYQYLSAGEADFNNGETNTNTEFNAQSHELSIGVRYDF